MSACLFLLVAMQSQQPIPFEGASSDEGRRLWGRQSRKLDYESWQASKLDREKRNIATFDVAIERQLARRLKTRPEWVQSPVLCVGARLGGEVRAFRTVHSGLLAVGIDFNPGARNAWVMWGDAHHLNFDASVFGTLYTNILDHVSNVTQFAAEAARVLRPGGTLMVDIDQNKPDSYAVHDLREKAPAFLDVFGRYLKLLSKHTVLHEKDSPKIAAVFQKSPHPDGQEGTRKM